MILYYNNLFPFQYKYLFIMSYDKNTTINIFLFGLCLLLIFGSMIYLVYSDYDKYQKQEGNVGRKISKAMNSITKILKILKCPTSIFANIQKCAGYYFRDKLFQFIWLIVWLINFVLIYIPVFVLDKIICFTFRKCWNLTPLDVCISKKTFFKIIENIYFLISGGGRYLHRDSSDIRKCYCSPPLIFLFDPLRNFKSYFEQVVKKSGPNYGALILPIIILAILLAKNTDE
jgi:hypothetical protein